MEHKGPSGKEGGREGWGRFQEKVWEMKFGLFVEGSEQQERKGLLYPMAIGSR